MSSRRGVAKPDSNNTPADQPKISKYFTQQPVTRATRLEDSAHTSCEGREASDLKDKDGFLGKNSMKDAVKSEGISVDENDAGTLKSDQKGKNSVKRDGVSVNNENSQSEEIDTENGDDEEVMDSERTQAYELDAPIDASKLQLPNYTTKDFESGSDSDEDFSNTDNVNNQDMGACASKRSGSDTEEEPNEPWKPVSSNKKNKERNTKKKQNTGKWSLTKRWSDRDTQTYRDGYPGKKDDPKLKDNLRFYKGEIPSYPDGDYIDNIHKDWWGDYRLLERHHGYIQWLFPIREDGMNWHAQALQLHEAQGITSDRRAKQRVLKSYQLMLDFYGMELVNSATGELARSPDWEERYHNLSWSSHNFLRITRILKSLGELGYEELKTPFLQFVLQEALEHRVLTKTLNSCRDYWIGTVKSDSDREMLYRYVEDHS